MMNTFQSIPAQWQIRTSKIAVAQNGVHCIVTRNFSSNYKQESKGCKKTGFPASPGRQYATQTEGMDEHVAVVSIYSDNSIDKQPIQFMKVIRRPSSSDQQHPIFDNNSSEGISACEKYSISTHFGTCNSRQLC